MKIVWDKNKSSNIKKKQQTMVEEYLGIKLFLHQKILIYLMNLFLKFMYTPAICRSESLLFTYVIRCILYQGINIVIVSGAKEKSRLIITEKIIALYNNSETLRAEIKELSTSSNELKCEFWNGSKIFVVSSADISRGQRANLFQN